MFVIKTSMRRNLARGIIQIFHRSLSSNQREYREVRVEVPWGHVSGKWWSPYNTRPIVSIHGWQDNCGTFNRLIPLLNKDVGFLTLDLPGHGYSSKLPNGMFYSFETHLLSIKYLANFFKWPKLSLMGHSMGGSITFMYGMLFPDEIDYMICIENFLLMDLRGLGFLANSLGKFSKNNSLAFRPQHESSSYSLDEIMRKIEKSTGKHVSLDYVHHLAERNIAEVEMDKGKYVFTTDPRTRVQGFPFVNKEDLFEKCTKNIKFPLLLIEGDHNGPFFDSPDYHSQGINVVKEANRNFEYHKVSGTHYLHLNTPENISDIINKFCDKYHESEERRMETVES